MKYLTGLTAALVALGAASFSHASSHREAPFITGQPKVDATDFYMFRSYETGRTNYVTLIANYQPFQDPQGGPNFYMFDPNALYEISIDNNGDGAEDLTLQFQFNNTSKNQTVPAGNQMTPIPLINSGQITRVNDAQLNVRETYTVNLVRGDRRTGARVAVTETGGNRAFDKPVDNIGEKTFPNGYAPYARQHVYDVTVPGCPAGGRIFVGQRKESFYIAVGKTFDLFNLDPLGPEVGGNNNDLEAKNVSTIAVELPINCVKGAGNDPVIGGYTTASVRQSRMINPNPASGLGNATQEGGAFAQVSRLGMPLVNEVIIGLPDKDRFNASEPTGDSQFANYVTHPALPSLIQALFPAVQAPNNFPRTDLVAAFLTGIQGLNQPNNVVASEMLRLNTSTPPVAFAEQNPLGVIAGDNAGFPNGRRPADDVVDVSLRVAMGVLCKATGREDTLNVGCRPGNAPSGSLAFTDGVRKTARDYGRAFPYLMTPIPGNFNPPTPAGSMP
ncbi:DUF4331 domain-containing protein [Ramlibacter sp. PS3R-8]|uniref:DUF4331 domain-containing protein n=1 Tax=Ramlibacter sp. PS3R-8 TaxID=3133437 RepID=UPI00309AEE36